MLEVGRREEEATPGPLKGNLPDFALEVKETLVEVPGSSVEGITVKGVFTILFVENAEVEELRVIEIFKAGGDTVLAIPPYMGGPQRVDVGGTLLNMEGYPY